MTVYSGWITAVSAVCLVFGLFIPAQAEIKDDPLHGVRQALVVKTDAWDASHGILQWYERKDTRSAWRAVGGKIPVVVGRKGLGWGAGIHPVQNDEGPVKREGDGKAPAGIFRLGAAFGYEPVEQVSWIRLPYLQAMHTVKCVDDPASRHYNCIVDAAVIKPDWKSHEEMLRPDDQYRLGAFVGHNSDPVVAGQGSCIFLHIWKAPREGTSGCTAMSAENMTRLIRRINPDAMPVLIQLPREEYKSLRLLWKLP